MAFPFRRPMASHRPAATDGGTVDRFSAKGSVGHARQWTGHHRSHPHCHRRRFERLVVFPSLSSSPDRRASQLASPLAMTSIAVRAIAFTASVALTPAMAPIFQLGPVLTFRSRRASFNHHDGSLLPRSVERSLPIQGGGKDCLNKPFQPPIHPPAPFRERRLLRWLQYGVRKLTISGALCSAVQRRGSSGCCSRHILFGGRQWMSPEVTRRESRTASHARSCHVWKGAGEPTCSVALGLPVHHHRQQQHHRHQERCHEGTAARASEHGK